MWAPSKAVTATQNQNAPVAPYEFDPLNPNDLTRRAIDMPRPIKVVVVGAGMSGIIAGIFFPRHIQNLELVILEKNPDLGGTWYESRYPGVACDVPSHAYQFSFESNTQWSSYWAGGAEIQAYLKRVAEKYNATKYMKFNRKVSKAEWDEDAGKWGITYTKSDTGETVTETADVFISARGVLNDWKMPDIPGMNSFKGRLFHSANWDRETQIDGERVALIGGGSSGIQILPNIQPRAAHVDHYMKGKTWIPPFGIGGQGVMNRGGDPVTPAEDLKRFEDPEEYKSYRKEIESMLHGASDVIYKGTLNSLGFQKMCEDHMRTKLAKKPEVFEALLPTFAPACRRLTPGPGYLEALVEDNVSFVSTGIKEINETGIVTLDGQHRPVDSIICATGFSGYGQPFPVIGKNGINLQDMWNDSENGIPEAYLAVAPENMPNHFICLGPNGGPGIGSTVPFLEEEVKYMIKCVQKLQREWIKSMTVKSDAVKEFGNYCDQFLEPTVFNSSCRCWWRHKSVGRLLAIWPGSALHGMYAWQNPRWEDYDYVLKAETNGSRFGWLGNGYVMSQLNGGNTTFYLDEPPPSLKVPARAEEKKTGVYVAEKDVAAEDIGWQHTVEVTA